MISSCFEYLSSNNKIWTRLDTLCHLFFWQQQKRGHAPHQAYETTNWGYTPGLNRALQSGGFVVRGIYVVYLLGIWKIFWNDRGFLLIILLHTYISFAWGALQRGKYRVKLHDLNKCFKTFFVVVSKLTLIAKRFLAKRFLVIIFHKAKDWWIESHIWSYMIIENRLLQFSFSC